MVIVSRTDVMVDQNSVSAPIVLDLANTMAITGSEDTAAEASDEDTLNFLLNIGYLEAAYYSVSTSGHGLSAENAGCNPGRVTGGSRVSFVNPVIEAYAVEISGQKSMHVRILRELLGEAAVSCPDLDLRNSFNAFAQASFGQDFNPYANDTNFLMGSYVLDDVAVTACRGALSLLRKRSHIEAVTGILVVEAHHSAIVRSSLFATQDALVSNVTMAISQTRSALANDGKPDVDDHGIGTLSKSHIVNVHRHALGHSRSALQVLNILYGDSGRLGQGGAFFPGAMNGNIR